MQKLFTKKISFSKFLSMSDKPWLDQLKIITALLLVSWYKLLWKPNNDGEIPVLRTNEKPQQLIKHTKISYSIASLVLSKFSCRT